MVNVVNKNDEAPVFTVNEYYGSVTEELDGSPVFVLQVKKLLYFARQSGWTFFQLCLLFTCDTVDDFSFLNSSSLLVSQF